MQLDRGSKLGVAAVLTSLVHELVQKLASQFDVNTERAKAVSATDPIINACLEAVASADAQDEGDVSRSFRGVCRSVCWCSSAAPASGGLQRPWRSVPSGLQRPWHRFRGSRGRSRATCWRRPRCTPPTIGCPMLFGSVSRLSGKTRIIRMPA